MSQTATVNVEERIAAPAERVASYISDFRNAKEWMAGVESVEHLGGDTYRLNLDTPVARLTPEAEITGRGDLSLHWAYVSVIEGGGSIEVAPEGEGCVVHYRGEFAPRSRLAGRAAKLLGVERFAYRNGERSLTRLRALMEARRY
jgi:carbon monoxide dehydrogenase subunit G